MKLPHVIGADLSKASIDLFCHGFQSHLKIKNDMLGFKEMLQWLIQQKITLGNVLIVMEHTGLYSYHFESFLFEQRISFSKVPALAIKRSLGMIRGKNDRIDAQRIARYGCEKMDTLKLESPANADLARLQILHSTRERLVKQRSSLMCAVKEYRIILPKEDPVIADQLALIDTFTRQIKKIEQQINLMIKQQSLDNTYQLLTSVKGVGPVVAVATIIKTKNFTAFKNARKFSCYTGSAPFEHSSGTSIKKKNRISHLADKPMKTLLTQAAKTAIQHDKELKAFYERRLTMGKSKKSTINVVRNKIIYRMFAVIKRQTPFIIQYSKTA